MKAEPPLLQALKGAVTKRPPIWLMRQAGRILDSVKGRNGHVFNLGHGILQHTPVENVKQLIEFVHDYTRR